MRLAVVVPAAPLLVPELVGAAAERVRPLLDACLSALRAVPDGAPLVLVGPGEQTRRHPPGAWGTLAGLGIPLEVPAADPRVGEAGDGEAGRVGRARRPELPQSLTVARWLVEQAAAASGRAVRLVVQQGVATDLPTGAALELGRALAAEAGPAAAWVVAGDGSARRSPKGPASLDPRAAGFDAAVAAALAGGDPRGLADLDAGLAGELLAAGRAPWQVLAGAALAEPAAPAGPAAPAEPAGVPPRAELLWDGAPFGVCYLVARWQWPTIST